MTQTTEFPHSEQEKVDSWRLHVLIEAGYPSELAEKLASEGTPVAFLEGGILAWEAEGLPVERPD